MPTLDSAPDLAQFAYQGYDPGTPGPIAITRAQLTENGQSREVYVVGLSGTDVARANSDGQSVGLITDLLVGGGFPGYANFYTQGVRDAMAETIPEGASVIFAGHSLGGMVAQQAAADPWIKSTYDVQNTVAFGAPLIAPGLREGDVQRLGATGDPVPLLSVAGLILPAWRDLGLNTENSGYWNPLNAHNKSYLEEATWGKYDALGVKNGDASITYDSRDVSFHRVEALIPRENGRMSTDPADGAGLDVVADRLVNQLQNATPEERSGLVEQANAILNEAGRTTTGAETGALRDRVPPTPVVEARVDDTSMAPGRG